MIRIPNELSTKFDTVAGRKELISQYGDSENMFFGVNADGEEVRVSIDTERGIICHTYQENGWVFVAVYDKDGHRVDGYYDGRWKEARP